MNTLNKIAKVLAIILLLCMILFYCKAYFEDVSGSKKTKTEQVKEKTPSKENKTKQVEDTKPTRTSCFKCRGTGKCQECNGTNKIPCYEHDTNRDGYCTNCNNRNYKICPYGKICKRCWGAGYY